MFEKTHRKSVISSCFIILLSFLAITEIIDIANDLWGVQLRLISAIFAEKVLIFSGFSIDRNFTILEVANMTFDIIPACNGSKAIKVTMISSCFIAIISKDLNLLGKFQLIVISLPLAILLNGLRISCLIALSVWSGVIIHADTFVHTLLGLVFFSISIYLLTKLAEKIIARQKGIYKFPLFYANLILLTLCMIPFFSACIRDWGGTSYNHNDQASFIFFLWGFVAYIYHSKISPKNYSQFKQGIIFCSVTLIITAFIYFYSPGNYILGISFLCLLSALNLAQRGSVNTIQKIPLLVIIFFGFPKTNEKLMELLNIQLVEALFIKLIISVILFTYLVFKFKKQVYTCTHAIPVSAYNFVFLFSSLLLGVQLFSIRQINCELPEQKIYYPYYISNWEGFDLQSEGNEVINRLYTKENQSAGVMVISSKGNRENIHTPEYCQFGIGWDVISRETINISNAAFSHKSVSKLELMRDGVPREFIYWFQNGDDNCASYSEFITKDTLLKLRGEKPQWHLFIVWSDDLENLEDFVRIIPPIES
ncbi:exosortase-associated EpsI family protein [Lentisphaera marina]|uniref:archaeosortase/exosortase family protein n=1 Tax=Lentisphaera marina TaxID=1111041 RepID=UPI0023671DBE|nr:archaeosortase/exosortase family protein [Lentisphaera marina]MDD7987227.1 exosortase-associated EpsI family protein [Lentisphaera marina]